MKFLIPESFLALTDRRSGIVGGLSTFNWVDKMIGSQFVLGIVTGLILAIAASLLFFVCYLFHKQSKQSQAKEVLRQMKGAAAKVPRKAPKGKGNGNGREMGFRSSGAVQGSDEISQV